MSGRRAYTTNLNSMCNGINKAHEEALLELMNDESKMKQLMSYAEEMAKMYKSGNGVMNGPNKGVKKEKRKVGLSQSERETVKNGLLRDMTDITNNINPQWGK